MLSRKRKSPLDISDRHFRRLIRAKIHHSEESVVSQLHNIDADLEESIHSQSSIHSHTSHTSSLDETIGCDVTLTIQNDDDIISETTGGQFPQIGVSSSQKNGEFETSLDSDLRQWVVKHKIKRTAVSDLLVVLRKHSSELRSNTLPKDYRSFLKTPRKTALKVMSPGFYYHFDLRTSIFEILAAEKNVFKFDELSLKVGIDGLPISDSNNSQLWPILGCIHPSKTVFLIGLYHGYTKPADANDFIRYFIEDIIQVINDGIHFNGRKLQLFLRCLIADAPAKSFILKTKGHTGYYSCSKCEQEGNFIEGRMSFPLTNSKKRSLESFTLKENPEYHVGTSLLLNIPNFNIVADVPLDYMHLVCIGVVKKIISLWIKGPLNVRLPSKKVSDISAKLIAMKPYITRDFARKPQVIINYSNWKATELRQFLLYTGPVVLLNILPKKMYYHFITLHVAIRILCCSKFSADKSKLKYAHDLIEHFVNSFKIIYGQQFISHNVHGLIHLKDDVERLGSLDTFSAFPFENFMKTIKSYITKPEQPLQQVHRRYTERLRSSLNSERSSCEEVNVSYHSDGPLIQNCCFDRQLKQKQIGQWFFSVNLPDKYSIINNKTVIQIENFAYCSTINQDVVIGREFKKYEDIYKIPCEQQPCIMVWCVVEFDDGLQAVPKCWIDDDICYWPLYSGPNAQNKFDRASKVSLPPEKGKWKTYKCTILGVYDTYDLAHSKLKVAELQSDLGTDEESVRKRNRSKRKPRKCDSSGSSDSDQDESFLQIQPFPSADEPSENKGPATPMNCFPEYSISKQNKSINCQCSCLDEEYKSGMKKDITEIKNKIDVILQILRNNPEKSTPEDIQRSLQDDYIFPLKTMEDLEIMERQLDDKEYKTKLIQFLSQIGGHEMNSTARNILKRVISNELACKFNWEGKKGKRRFSTLKIAESITIAIRKAKPNNTEHDIITAIKNWLRHATARLNLPSRKGNDDILAEDNPIHN